MKRLKFVLVVFGFRAIQISLVIEFVRIADKGSLRWEGVLFCLLLLSGVGTALRFFGIWREGRYLFLGEVERVSSFEMKKRRRKFDLLPDMVTTFLVGVVVIKAEIVIIWFFLPLVALALTFFQVIMELLIIAVRRKFQ
jgi:uncharacterized membrane protein YbhN (UPF0104 family)